ncbi:proton-conducting transporter membrane subunit [Proteinivorax hydrogeniformans]|uniref:Proton-conducting transporter membrane subunit n=1 Tax=Proteinivorax hydrogeniformans TaxID=1826727 RepID=A0AAU8HSE4_9FIRM
MELQKQKNICSPRESKRSLNSLTAINNGIIFLLTIAALAVIFSMELGYFSNFRTELISFVYGFNGYVLLIIFIPLIFGTLAVLMFSNHEVLRDILVVNVTFITFILMVITIPAVSEGVITLQVSEVLGLGLNFTLDMLALVLGLLTTIIWLMVTIYAPDYMNMEEHRNRFYLFLMLTFGFILGTILSGCLFTTFLFFEGMTFSSYMLVVHCETKKCIEAGDSYIYMGIMGGLCILLAMVLLFVNVGTLEYSNLAVELQNLGGIEYVILALFIVGFGVKAGLVPLHIWLPKAHPIAPTPASALLSGIMVKIGAYGMIRILTTFSFPEPYQVLEGFTDSVWMTSQNIGFVLIWMGILTMGIGVFMALQQGNMKRMLAYHSVSQMGYIIMGIGVAVYLGYKGAMGYSGAVYHIINHALFKSLLFMVAGVVYLKIGTLDMYKMGGLWRKLPFTFAVSTIAALGITGMPLFNGFASKTLLHHAIEESFMYGHSSFKLAELLFVLISAGTACSFIKWTYYIFLGKCPENLKNVKGEYPMMNLAMSGIAIMIIFIGIFPNFLLDTIIIPSAESVTYDPEFIDNYIVDINIFARSDLLGMIPVYLMGLTIFCLGTKFHLFHLNFPRWLSVGYICALPLTVVLKAVEFFDKKINRKKQRSDKNSNINKKVTLNSENNKSGEGVINKFVSLVYKGANKVEYSIINCDIIIYSVVLTLMLVFLFVVK